MKHCRLKEETLERLKRKKLHLFLNHGKLSYDLIINEALDALDGKKLRKLERERHALIRDKDNLIEANSQWRKDYKKAIEEKKELELRIEQLENQVNSAKIEEYKKAIEEKKELEDRIQQLNSELGNLKFVHKALSKEYDALKGRLAELENPDIDLLRNKIDEKEKIITFKDSEIERLNRLIEENKLKLNNAETLIDDNEKMRSELSELRSKDDKLIIALNSQGKELRYIRETINSEIDRIGKLNSIIDIVPALRKLKEDLNRKIEFELQKQTELAL